MKYAAMKNSVSNGKSPQNRMRNGCLESPKKQAGSGYFQSSQNQMRSGCSELPQEQTKSKDSASNLNLDNDKYTDIKPELSTSRKQYNEAGIDEAGICDKRISSKEEMQEINESLITQIANENRSVNENVGKSNTIDCFSDFHKMDIQECKKIRAAVDMPYPPVRVEGKNRRYGYAMLQNMSGRESEFSTITQYIYDGFVARDMLNKEEAAKIFQQISIVEMHHLSIFGQLACLLGVEPRFWSLKQGRQNCMQYWNAGYNTYEMNYLRLLKEAIKGEQQAIYQYQSQCKWIRDEYVQENLQRIIKDEELHVEILQKMYKCYIS